MIQALTSNLKPYLPYVPLLTPAISQETYQIDHQLIRKRTVGVALICFAAMAIALIYQPVFSLIGLLWMPIALLDTKLSNLALDRLAVREYLDVQNPSQKCFDRIGSNTDALRALTERTDNLYKFSVEGKDLFHNCRDLETLEFYVDNHFNFSREDHYIYNLYGPNPPNINYNPNYTYLERVVMHLDPSFLHYLIQRGCIIPDNFTPERQHRILFCISQAGMVNLLVEAGFNINERNQEGKTPLQSLLLTNDILRNIGRFSFDEHIKALLDNGADPRMTVMHEGSEKNALELASGYPEIESIIRERMH